MKLISTAWKLWTCAKSTRSKGCRLWLIRLKPLIVSHTKTWKSVDTRAGIHQQIEIEGKNSTFGDVDIWPSISLVFTNKKRDSVFRGRKQGFCACAAGNSFVYKSEMKWWVALNFHLHFKTRGWVYIPIFFFKTIFF